MAIEFPKNLDRHNDPYSMEEFVFHSTDRKGHHATVGPFAIPPELDYLVDRIVESKCFPFRTNGDFWRDAGYRLALFLHDHQEDGLGNFLQSIKTLSDSCMEEEYNRKYEEQLREIVLMINSTPSHDRKVYLARRVAHDIDSMPDGYWKDLYVNGIIEPHLRSLLDEEFDMRRDRISGSQGKKRRKESKDDE